MAQLDEHFVGPLDEPGALDRSSATRFGHLGHRAAQAASPTPARARALHLDSTGPVLSTRFGNADGTWFDAYVAERRIRRGEAGALHDAGADHRRDLAAPTSAVSAGPAFRPAKKWSFIPKNSARPMYLVVNADEGEPGTFKDRYILERDPHALLEGMIIAAYAIGSHKAYVYIRGEYFRAAHRFNRAVRGGPRARVAGHEHPGQRLRSGRGHPSRRRRLHLRRRDGPADITGRRQGLSEAQAAVPGHLRPVPLPDDRQQRRDAGVRAVHPSRRGRALCAPRHVHAGRDAAVLRVRARQAAGTLRGAGRCVPA